MHIQHDVRLKLVYCTLTSCSHYYYYRFAVFLVVFLTRLRQRTACLKARGWCGSSKIRLLVITWLYIFGGLDHAHSLSFSIYLPTFPVFSFLRDIQTLFQTPNRTYFVPLVFLNSLLKATTWVPTILPFFLPFIGLTSFSSRYFTGNLHQKDTYR